MLKVIAAETNSNEIRNMKVLLEKSEDVAICGLFSCQEDLIQYIFSNSQGTDVLLLDINMPGMNWRKLVEWISSVAENISIILVSDCEKYTVEAFEMEVEGYLLKPLEQEKLKKFIKKISKNKNRTRLQHVHSTSRQKKISIDCFGQFRISRDEENKTIRWRNSKSEELLALLIQERGAPVTRDYIIDKLWFETDPDRASINLNTVVYQLRKNLQELGLDDFVESIKSTGSYYISKDKYICDVIEFEICARLFKQKGHIQEAERAISFYKGEYLAGKDYSWANTKRWHLEKLAFEMLEALYNHYEKSDSKKAEELLIKMLELNDYDEEGYERLIEYYGTQNNKRAARDIRVIMQAKAL